MRRAAFASAVRSLEAGPALAAPGVVRTIADGARRRDALTLLMLSDVDGLSAEARGALLERLSVLNPPADPATYQRTLAGDRQAFWAWYGDLPLPALKNWWANWRDVFPR